MMMMMMIVMMMMLMMTMMMMMMMMTMMKMLTMMMMTTTTIGHDRLKCVTVVGAVRSSKSGVSLLLAPTPTNLFGPQLF